MDMDKSVFAVILSIGVYVIYILLPMMPAVLIYRMFPDTKISASGVLSNLNFKTTGAFSGYVITVFLGYFIIQNTLGLIDKINTPVYWTLKTKIELQKEDGTIYYNDNLLETLNITIDPELKNINGNTVILKLPGDRKSWQTTQLKFEIPHYGYKYIDMSEISKNSDIDNSELMLTKKVPIKIQANNQVLTQYQPTNRSLESDNSVGPKLKKGE